MNCLKCGAPVILEKTFRLKFSCEVCGLIYEGEKDWMGERQSEAAYIENGMFPWHVVPFGTLLVLGEVEV